MSAAGAGAGAGAASALSRASAAVAAAASASDSSVNVKVAVRVRPQNRKEKDMGSEVCVDVHGSTLDVVRVEDPDAPPKSYTFDYAYPPAGTTQEKVYTDLAAPIIKQAMNGYNGTIFAYGQTGSGKTFSMMGESDDPGIIPRLNKDMFTQLTALKEEGGDGKQFLVLVSYLEIYNEVIKDLLNPSHKQLRIREHPELGIYVEHLAELVVKNEDDVAKLLEQGTKVRKVAATQMNDRSSRSHSCFIIKIEQKTTENIGDVQRETVLTARINLVDLAGSERASKTGATGDRLKEGAAINKSLSALGNVINSLAEGKRGHIPYRDSKLTRLLQESLGGNALTAMIATCSPSAFNYDETLSTLQYANRAKSIKNETKRNEDVNEKIIRELRMEIDTLRDQLARLQSQSGGTVPSDKVQAMEEMIANLERAKQNSWEEKERLSKLYEEERKKNLASETKIKSVMKTIKEDNKELMKRMRQLLHVKTQLRKEFKAKKEGHIVTRENLATAMTRYQELHADGGEDGPHKEELEKLLSNIEELHKRVEAESSTLRKLKEQLAENERQQMEERAEAAAQRMLLEEDAELRKAIQDEEREKLEKDNAVLLERALDDERAKLKLQAENEKRRLLEKFHAESAQTSAREQELELAVLQASADKSMLLLEIEQLKKRHGAEQTRLREEHKALVRENKIRELAMFRQVVEGFEEERTLMETKYSEIAKLLQQAVQDIVFLSERNQELERALMQAAAYEPDT